MFEKIIKHYGDDLTGKKFAFWGVSFKANTDDVRESPAIYMADALTKAGAEVHFYDPEGSDNFEKEMVPFKHAEGKLRRFENMYECLSDCDGLVTMTEWREFRIPTFDMVKSRLKTPVIFDARNLYDTEKVLGHGFKYFAIGKHIE